MLSRSAPLDVGTAGRHVWEDVRRFGDKRPAGEQGAGELLVSRGAVLAPGRAGRFTNLSRGAALVKHARVSRLGSALSTRKSSARNLLGCFCACSGNDEDGERPAAGGGSPLCLQAPAAACSSAFCSCFTFTSQLMTSLIAESSVQLTAHSRLLEVCEKDVHCPSAAQTHPSFKGLL